MSIFFIFSDILDKNIIKWCDELEETEGKWIKHYKTISIPYTENGGGGFIVQKTGVGNFIEHHLEISLFLKETVKPRLEGLINKKLKFIKEKITRDNDELQNLFEDKEPYYIVVVPVKKDSEFRVLYFIFHDKNYTCS